MDVFGVRVQDLLGILLHGGEQYLHRLLQLGLLTPRSTRPPDQRTDQAMEPEYPARQTVVEPQRIVELLEPAIGS